MADKKRNRKEKVDRFAREMAYSQVSETFDESLDRIMQETLSSVIEAETYPRSRGNNNTEEEDDTQVYYCQRKTERYEQDPYTVAQHMVDRTQFRH